MVDSERRLASVRVNIHQMRLGREGCVESKVYIYRYRLAERMIRLGRFKLGGYFAEVS